MRKNDPLKKGIRKTDNWDDLRYLYGDLTNAYRMWPDMEDVIEYLRNGVRFVWKTEELGTATKCTVLKRMVARCGVLGQVFLDNSYVREYADDPDDKVILLSKAESDFVELRMVSPSRLQREFIKAVEGERPDLVVMTDTPAARAKKRALNKQKQSKHKKIIYQSGQVKSS